MSETLLSTIDPLVRLAGRDRPTAQVLRDALSTGRLAVQSRPASAAPADDYVQLDPALTIQAPGPAERLAPPHPTASYAGYTPQQRYQLLQWLQDPTQAAPSSFQQFYLAHLEVHLFESAQARRTAQCALLRLQSAPAWAGNTALQRALLLSFWLQQDGDALGHWIATTPLHPDVLGVALGQLALLHAPLTPELLRALLANWYGRSELDVGMAKLRLTSLNENLGAEPLAHALAQLGDDARMPTAWRCAHRDLRIALPQPNLQPELEPLIAEVAEITPAGASMAPEADEEISEDTPDRPWHLVLEFGQSRSEYFEFALRRARQRPGYSQLMDEDRNMIYRVVFRKRELRHFWQLWDYVQNWSSTHVYLNGEELEKWKIWPYSQYLR